MSKHVWRLRGFWRCAEGLEILQTKGGRPVSFDLKKHVWYCDSKFVSNLGYARALHDSPWRLLTLFSSEWGFVRTLILHVHSRLDYFSPFACLLAHVQKYTLITGTIDTTRARLQNLAVSSSFESVRYWLNNGCSWRKCKADTDADRNSQYVARSNTRICPVIFPVRIMVDTGWGSRVRVVSWVGLKDSAWPCRDIRYTSRLRTHIVHAGACIEKSLEGVGFTRCQSWPSCICVS